MGDYIRSWNADENIKGMRHGIPKSQYSHDGQVKGSENFVQLVKNTYRVLLGR
ncbi:hypothetical protein [Sphingobacterium phlebotomi]|uniref:hypothetical protein n=1 Tax=Sphingobacterium phlebotomi TaxID=2605433 RepID=UPI00165357FA|nr:hypothetical protein [Sphingobacterium phlebotomi]